MCARCSARSGRLQRFCCCVQCCQGLALRYFEFRLAQGEVLRIVFQGRGGIIPSTCDAYTGRPKVKTFEVLWGIHNSAQQDFLSCAITMSS